MVIEEAMIGLCRGSSIVKRSMTHSIRNRRKCKRHTNILEDKGVTLESH